LSSGASFDIDELDVIGGEDIAFAWALLRCGSAAELQERPDRRLRLTLGLRRHEAGWVIEHEHHSFTHP
jgi:ketosteroid isomerase-like protein